MAFIDFLKYLQGPGIGIAIGFILSFVVEWYPEWNDVDPKAKRIAFFVLSTAIPVAAAAAGAATGYWGWDFETVFWPALVAGFTAFGAGTLAHTRSVGNTE